MIPTVKHAYRLELSAWSPGVTCPDVTPLTPSDAPELAALMVSAYRGTIDDEGESEDDARAWIAAFFSGAAPQVTGGQAVPGLSMGLRRDGALVSACLVTAYQAQAFISIVMTHPDRKGQGLAGQVLGASLKGIRSTGQVWVYAAITEGNRPSEALFSRVGFARCAPP